MTDTVDDTSITAKYWIETPHALEHAAAVIAGEQSTATFVPVKGESADIRARHAATVVRIEPLDAGTAPSLPGSRAPDAAAGGPIYRRGIVEIRFPFRNVGASLPNLLATVAGNLYELQEVSGLRLLDLELPLAFAERYPGPAFGIAGTRRLAGVHGRPLVGTIIKPSIGLPTTDLRALVRELALAGIDFIKDDELQANPPYAPFDERVAAVMDEIERAADRTGRRTMYAFNITEDVDTMLRQHDLVARHRGTCVMVSMNAVGLAAVAKLRAHSALPIHGHRNFFGAISRCPQLGVAFTAYQKLCRLAGADHLHVGGLASKFYESDEEVVRSIGECLTPMFGDDRVMPVLSSAQWAGTAVATYRATRTIDVIHLAGGGILAHPLGVEAGVMAMRQGWEAALSGAALDDYAASRPELRAAIDAFGRRPARSAAV